MGSLSQRLVSALLIRAMGSQDLGRDALKTKLRYLLHAHTHTALRVLGPAHDLVIPSSPRGVSLGLKKGTKIQAERAYVRSYRINGQWQRRGQQKRRKRGEPPMRGFEPRSPGISEAGAVKTRYPKPLDDIGLLSGRRLDPRYSAPTIYGCCLYKRSSGPDVGSAHLYTSICWWP